MRWAMEKTDAPAAHVAHASAAPPPPLCAAQTTDPRMANTVILMVALALTAVVSIVAVCTNYLATSITAKAI